MGLVNGVVPNMFNGVSQQPNPLRHPSQGDIQDNGYATIATGLRKRAPFQHIAKLRNLTANDAMVHMINRDAVERYQVIFLDGDIEVYDLAGNQQTVLFPDGKDYLANSVPRTGFDAVTIADFTFIVNKNITCAMEATLSPATLTGTVQKFSDLPAVTTGHVYKIEGDDVQRFDDYHVIGDASGVWVETIAPSQLTSLDASTMPHTLVRTGVGEFTFRQETWADRLVGGETAAPIPSFVGLKLRGIFFHRNRLGLLADEGTIMTRNGNFFNFWRKTVTAILDDDPIDVQVSHTKVSILNHAVPFDKSLLLFSDQTQFQLTAKDTLTPKTGNADVVTEFESSLLAKPVALGNSVYFTSNKNTSSSVREYFVDDDTVSNDASDVTAHAPSYVPANVFKIVASSTEDVVMCLSLDDRNAIYVYKVYWNAEEKAQSAWSRFVFDEGDTVLSLDFINSTVYAVISRADGIYLEKSELQEFGADSGFDFLIHLDRKVSLTGVYTALTDETVWTLPYSDAGTFCVIQGSTWPTDAGAKLTTRRDSDTTITAAGDWSAYPCIVGREYRFLYRFSEQWPRDNKSIAIQSGKTVLKSMEINYDLTGYFQVEVTPQARATRTYKFTGSKLGTLSAIIGTPSIGSGTFKFPVRTNNRGVTIDIVSDSYMPCFIQNAEWTAEFVQQTSRI